MRKLRERKFLTQNQLAKRLGVKQQYISYLENGNIDGLTLQKLFRLAHIFNISPYRMLFILIRDKKKRSHNWLPFIFFVVVLLIFLLFLIMYNNRHYLDCLFLLVSDCVMLSPTVLDSSLLFFCSKTYFLGAEQNWLTSA